MSRSDTGSDVGGRGVGMQTHALAPNPRPRPLPPDPVSQRFEQSLQLRRTAGAAGHRRNLPQKRSANQRQTGAVVVISTITNLVVLSIGTPIAKWAYSSIPATMMKRAPRASRVQKTSTSTSGRSGSSSRADCGRRRGMKRPLGIRRITPSCLAPIRPSGARKSPVRFHPRRQSRSARRRARHSEAARSAALRIPAPRRTPPAG
jgi:hypothetical protein